MFFYLYCIICRLNWLSFLRTFWQRFLPSRTLSRYYIYLMLGCKWDVSSLWTKCVIMVVFCFWCTGFGEVAWGDIISGCTYGEWVTKVWTFSCLIEYAVTVMLSSIFESRVVLKHYELKPLAKMLIIHWREPILFSILRFCVKFSEWCGICFDYYGWCGLWICSVPHLKTVVQVLSNMESSQLSLLSRPHPLQKV